MYMLRSRWLSIAVPLLLSGLSGACPAAERSWKNASPVSERELTSMRGGVMLPDGLNIDIGIDIQTQVNGVLVLHTVLSTAAPPAQGLRIFTAGAAPSNAGATTVMLAAAEPPMLILNRSGSTSTLVTSSAPLNPTVLVLNAPTNVWPQYPDEDQLNVVPNGAPVSTPNGEVQAHRSGDNTSVILNGNGLTVQHLLGDTTGVVVANQLNNQSIQSMTVVDIDLHGTWPATANAMFNVGNLAIAAVRRP